MAGESYWAYQSGSSTPRGEEVPDEVFRGTHVDWESLSPGMRREIARGAATHAGGRRSGGGVA